jgi:hypothetical protein
MVFAATAAMAAGKTADNRAPAPRAAAKATPRVDVANQVKADMKGSKNFKNCKTRSCLHSHQH